ncbi:MAG: tRNA (N(6)-L-threonylcarbamoyladenosine(37)-C(2))-methylthiotransferase MtaB [Arenicellales bacterium]|jgi:threonylcarbamoyladenosine tRNA methylthiotransferase MtaB|nr:tRNA (N(6)-L-threonylcarbamoyladenosine(37)-C(2))-methylthiotransferase MtaB [Arenicellales bacterium]|tara:strand:+ start:461 stop:1804 length:1344 start_codon:yes stop_codon:yes gene_type:complete
MKAQRSALANGSRVALTTLGCKVNAYESAIIAQRLGADHWTRVGERECADLYVINSCTVTAEADRQTRQAVRRALRLNPAARVVVTGCYAQNDPQACADIPGVSLVVGNEQKLSIPGLICDLPVQSGRPTPVCMEQSADAPIQLLNGYHDRTRALVQVQQGCDQSCTFCVIHRARGASRSLAVDAVVRQVRRFIAQGYREIVVCGIDLGSYGQERGGPAVSLAALLAYIANLPGDFRIRLSSLDPVHLDDQLLEVLASSPRFCPYLHLSIQCGSTLILKRMGRRYDAALVRERVVQARGRIPGLILGGDIMVGFPTESAEDFAQTLRLIDDLNIIYPHVFTYSARPGTPAARISRQVPKNVRRERAAVLRQAGQQLRTRALDSQLWQEAEMLVEQVNPGGSAAYHGRLANYMPVWLSTPPAGAGCFQAAQIVGRQGDTLVARALGRE